MARKFKELSRLATNGTDKLFINETFSHSTARKAQTLLKLRACIDNIGRNMKNTVRRTSDGHTRLIEFGDILRLLNKALTDSDDHFKTISIATRRSEYHLKSMYNTNDLPQEVLHGTSVSENKSGFTVTHAINLRRAISNKDVDDDFIIDCYNLIKTKKVRSDKVVDFVNNIYAGD